MVLYTDGGTIINRADPIEYIHLKIKTVDSRELQLALKGAKYSLQETDEAYDPLPDAKETLNESDSQGLFTVSLQKPKSGTAYYRLTQTGYSFGYRADGAPAEICFSVSETGEISRPAGDSEIARTDAELYGLSREMIRTDPEDVAGFLTKWVALQERISETLPLIPIYSNMYFDFYTSELRGYSVQAASWADAILTAYMGYPDE